MDGTEQNAAWSPIRMSPHEQALHDLLSSVAGDWSLAPGARHEAAAAHGDWLRVRAAQPPLLFSARDADGLAAIVRQSLLGRLAARFPFGDDVSLAGLQGVGDETPAGWTRAIGIALAHATEDAPPAAAGTTPPSGAHSPSREPLRRFADDRLARADGLWALDFPGEHGRLELVSPSPGWEDVQPTSCIITRRAAADLGACDSRWKDEQQRVGRDLTRSEQHVLLALFGGLAMLDGIVLPATTAEQARMLLRRAIAELVSRVGDADRSDPRAVLTWFVEHAGEAAPRAARGRRATSSRWPAAYAIVAETIAALAPAGFEPIELPPALGTWVELAGRRGQPTGRVGRVAGRTHARETWGARIAGRWHGVDDLVAVRLRGGAPRLVPLSRLRTPHRVPLLVGAAADRPNVTSRKRKLG